MTERRRNSRTICLERSIERTWRKDFWRRKAQQESERLLVDSGLNT